jgi:thiosulfate dehydrogenase [quinone] large subunit
MENIGSNSDRARFCILWAFVDKTFGLGFATLAERAWVNGGSPTSGFLKMGVNPDSPFKDVFTSLAGQAWVDWAFMLGLLGVG